MIRRLLLVPFALVLAVGAGSLFLFIAALADPAMADLMGRTLFAGFWSLMDAVFDTPDPGPLVAETLRDVGRVMFIFLVLPLLLVAAVGEVTKARGIVWLAGATGALTAAVPWILRGSARVTSPAEVHVSLVLGLTGAVAGLVYWALAGRRPVPHPTASSPGS